MSVEIWKDIENFPNYQISSLGRVRSLDRIIERSDGTIANLKERILKTFPLPAGYIYVDLKKNKKNIKQYIHRLVCEAFYPEYKGCGLEINHINGIRNDNRLENLEWINHTDNVRHSIYVLNTMQYGEKSANSKLTLEQVIQIRQNPDRLTQKELSKRFKVVQSIISRIVTGKRWNKAVAEYHQRGKQK
jgi:hypothetical protein